MGLGFEERLRALEERLDSLVRQRPTHREILEFCGAVIKEQLRAREKVQAPVPHADEPREARGERQVPRFRDGNIPIDLKIAEGLFESLGRLAQEGNETLREGIERIDEARAKGQIDMERLLGEMVLPEAPYTQEVFTSLGLNRDLLVFLGRASVQPLVEEAAEVQAEGIDLAERSKGACPVCGSLPILSTLVGEEGRRMLICSLCRFEWKIPRFACPFCGTEKHEGRSYLFIEGDPSVRIDVCDTCMKYIKTIDAREVRATIFPLLEDAATLHLDMLAQERGYQRGSPPFLEIG